MNKETIRIGRQIWQTSNLNVDRFRNGDPISQIQIDEEWEQRVADGEPSWCYYNNDPENGYKYGRLYNWWAVGDPRGLAPKGFHIPSDAEWAELIDYLGGVNIAGAEMKSTSGWKKNGNGTNSSGNKSIGGVGTTCLNLIKVSQMTGGLEYNLYLISLFSSYIWTSRWSWSPMGKTLALTSHHRSRLNISFDFIIWWSTKKGGSWSNDQFCSTGHYKLVLKVSKS